MWTFLFERPLELCATLGLVWLSVLLAWGMTRHKMWMQAFVGWGVCGVVLLGANVVVKTSNERVKDFFVQLKQDVQEKQLAGALAYLDTHYRHQKVSFGALQSKINGPWKKLRFADLKLSFRGLRWLSKDEAEVQLSCEGEAGVGGGTRPFSRSVWRMQVKRSSASAKGWVITQVDPLHLLIPNVGTPENLKQMMRMRI